MILCDVNYSTLFYSYFEWIMLLLSICTVKLYDLIGVVTVKETIFDFEKKHCK